MDIDFFPIGDAYISVLDNGTGMSESELIKAMQYGSKNPKDIRKDDDLGRYGLGMKTASLSQCQILTVLSKKDGVLSGCQWNLPFVRESETWSLIVFDNAEMKNVPNYQKLEDQECGSLVVWQDLDKFAVGEKDMATAFTKKIARIREHISLVFHRYLNGEQDLKRLTIRMNGEPLIGKDPFLRKKSTQIMDTERIVIRNGVVEVTPYILPHVSKLTKSELEELGGKDGLRRQQGFYVYRNKRLLVWGTWFRLMHQGDLSKLARVQVDIPNSLDDLWTLDIKKSSAIPPEEVKKNLAIVIDKISESSKRTWTYRGKKETTDKVVHFWNRIKTRDDGIYYEINTEHPLIKSIMLDYPEANKQIGVLLEQLSSNLPINQLYIDLTSDEKIQNEEEQSLPDLLAILHGIVDEYKDSSIRLSVIETLLETEPFCNYRPEIKNQIEKGEFDD